MVELFQQRELPILVAITKADKLSKGQRQARVTAIRHAVGSVEDQCVVTSAKTREGIDDLTDAVRELVASSRDTRDG